MLNPGIYRQFDKKAFRSVNPVDPVSIFEIGAKMLAMSCYRRKLRKGGN